MGAGGTVGFVSLALLLAAFLSPLRTSAAHAQQHQDQALPGCGICYPGGYDNNTVGSVRGKLVDLQLPDEGPVRLVVDGGGERWVVLASPTWFWKMTGLHLVPGDTVTVRGSKALGADGTLYVVAREILPPGTGIAAAVRDSHGAPLWRGGHRGGRRAGAGSGEEPGLGMGRGCDGVARRR